MKTIALLALFGYIKADDNFMGMLKHVCEGNPLGDFDSTAPGVVDYMTVDEVENCFADTAAKVGSTGGQINVDVIKEFHSMMGGQIDDQKALESISTFKSSCGIQSDDLTVGQVGDCYEKKAKDNKVDEDTFKAAWSRDHQQEMGARMIYDKIVQGCLPASTTRNYLLVNEFAACESRFDQDSDGFLKYNEYKKFAELFAPNLGEETYRVIARGYLSDPKRGIELKKSREIISHFGSKYNEVGVTDAFAFRAYFEYYKFVATYGYHQLDPLAYQQFSSLIDVCSRLSTPATTAGTISTIDNLRTCLNGFNLPDKFSAKDWDDMGDRMKTSGNFDNFLTSGLPALPFSVIKKRCSFSSNKITQDELMRCVQPATATNELNVQVYHEFLKAVDAQYTQPWKPPKTVVPFEVLKEFCNKPGNSHVNPLNYDGLGMCITSHMYPTPSTPHNPADPIPSDVWNWFQRLLGEFYEKKLQAEKQARKEARQQRLQAKQNRGRGLKELITQN